MQTQSDEYGNFELWVSSGDSLSLSSTIYKGYNFKINTEQIKDDFLILFLEPKANQLNEVVIKGKVAPNKFGLEAINKDFETIVTRDLNNNPHSYSKKEELLKQRIDLFGLIKIASKLLFKPKKQKAIAPTLTFEDYKTLLNTNELITTDFLTNDLKISADQIFAFFYYLEDEKIPLKKENHFEIRNTMINASKKFNR